MIDHTEARLAESMDFGAAANTDHDRLYRAWTTVH